MGWNHQLVIYQLLQSDLFYPLVGGHLTFEGITELSQKGRKELPGIYISIYILN